ncbi:MAG: hypothetical protein IPQ14_11380 [Candidatus Microthrix sp.]|uniref:hypothetical protein n=1 Tax=Candidatus Neomicrothrix sp. TaxID=2719034 RepID=UPI0025BC4A54|nr:hypothetical protein [Candidatus Microthrix sp.]MBL0204895.1 hypothetical protein [Candidatus Microthrix sp.]
MSSTEKQSVKTQWRGAQQVVELVDGAHETMQLGFQVDELLSLITSNDTRDQLAALQQLELFLDAWEVHGRAVG